MLKESSAQALETTSKFSSKGLRKLIEETKKRLAKGGDRNNREAILRSSIDIKDQEIQAQTQRAIEAEKNSTMKDHLTGLYSKQWFEDELVRSISEARRQGDKVWLIYADIDHFKGINDRHGHPVGDAVLRAFGEIGSREEEPIARIGGEEFAQIIHQRLNLEEISIILNRYSSNFKRSSRSILGYEATLSFGIAELSAEDTPLSIVQKADKALYHSKESGRDRATLLVGTLDQPFLKPIEFNPQTTQEAAA